MLRRRLISGVKSKFELIFELFAALLKSAIECAMACAGREMVFRRDRRGSVGFSLI